MLFNPHKNLTFKVNIPCGSDNHIHTALPAHADLYPTCSWALSHRINSSHAVPAPYHIDLNGQSRPLRRLQRLFVYTKGKRFR